MSCDGRRNGFPFHTSPNVTRNAAAIEYNEVMSASDDPFILVSASFHRSGSTWVQRAIAAATDAIVWGETGMLVPSLRTARELWQKRAPIADHERSEFLGRGMAAGVSIANMSPVEDELIEALRAFMRRLYAERFGRSRWGWKAVTYHADDIVFIRELFPDVRVVLLIRNLAEVYRSLRTLSWDSWWPGGPREIAELWARRSLSYLTLARDARVLLLKYEEVRTRATELAGLLELRDDRPLIDTLNTPFSPTPFGSLSEEEKRELSSGAGNVLEQLGYSLPD